MSVSLSVTFSASDNSNFKMNQFFVSKAFMLFDFPN